MKKRIIALTLFGLLAIASSAKAQFNPAYARPADPPAPTWFDSHTNYVKNYWHEAFEPPKPKRSAYLRYYGDMVSPPLVPSDVYVLGAFGASAWSYGVTNNYDMGACIERELHDGQWLAGGCKDLAYLLHADEAGNVSKFAHLGFAYMSNAEHGNTSFQAKVGFDLNSLGTLLDTVVTHFAPSLSLTPPPWVSKLGNAVTFDYSAGYRPVHDSSVNGNFTHGPMAQVNVPISTTFEWLISGL